MNTTSKVLAIIASLAAIAIAYSVVFAATVLPTGSSTYLYQWYSTDPSRVMVDANTGKITRIWTGTVKVCHQLKTDLTHEVCDTVN